MADKNEIWKDVPNYEGLYQISNFGRLKSVKKDIILTCKIRGNKYNSTQLYKKDNGKQFLLHRIVAQTFIPNPNNLPQVNHINGIKTDNRVENLEWVSASENINHAYKLGKIAGQSKIVLNTNNGIFYESAKKAAESININYCTLRAMLNGQNPNKTNFKFV